MNGYELVRMQEYQVDKRGDTMTGDLTIRKNDGSASKLNVHRTLNNNEIQGSFDVYNVGVGFGSNGGCALSTNNITTGQQEACYVFAKNSLWSPDRVDGSRPDLGGTDYPFKDSYFNGNMSIDASTGEKKIAFFNGRARKSYLYGQPNGKIGAYDGVNQTDIWYYDTNNRDMRVGMSLCPSTNNSRDLGTTAQRWRTLYSINAINTSDKNYKENIEYISNNKAKDIKEASVKADKITYQDMYDFYKDIEIAKYNYIDQEHQEFGFIAQDIANTKVGSEIVIDSDEGYMYSMGSYVSTVAGALKHSINKIDELEKENKELKDRLKLIEEKLGI